MTQTAGSLTAEELMFTGLQNDGSIFSRHRTLYPSRILTAVYILFVQRFRVVYIPLISLVFGPYCKLRTEVFSIDLWPFALGP